MPKRAASISASGFSVVGESSRFSQPWLRFEVVTSLCWHYRFTVDRNDFSFTVRATQLVQCSFSVAAFIGIFSGVNAERSIFIFVAA